MGFEKEIVKEEKEEKDDRTMTNLTRQKKPPLKKGANDLYFSWIKDENGITRYCKDSEAREDIADIEELINDIGTGGE